MAAMEGCGGVEIEPLSNQSRSDVAVYRFDEQYRRMSLAVPQINMQAYSGSAALSHLVFLQGCNILALLDESNRIRLFDIRQQRFLKNELSLPDGFLVGNIISTADGRCLMVVSQTQSDGTTEVLPFMAPTYSQLLSQRVATPGHISSTVFASFGGKSKEQHHLCFQSRESGVFSFVLDASNREMSRVITQEAKRESGTPLDVSGDQIRPTYLEHFFRVFDRFPASGAMECSRIVPGLAINVYFECDSGSFKIIGLDRRVRRYMEGVYEDLLSSKKPLQLRQLVQNLSINTLASLDTSFLHSTEEPMGSWLRRMICLVPIQIARAEDNRFLVLSDGVLLWSMFCNIFVH